MATVLKFRDLDVRPPKGGWGPVIQAITKQSPTIYTEADAIEFIAKWRRNNGTFVSELDIEREIWAWLCEAEPARCGQAGVPVSRRNAPKIEPRERTPQVQGPPIWTFLNTLAAAWTPTLHDYLLTTCDAIGAILDCPTCREHWRELLRELPPRDLNTRYAVCRWVNDIHNRVNQIAGHPFYPYERMVTEFGAPIS